MSAWTWVLIGLCAAGALLPVIPAFAVFRLLRRLRSRVDALQHARLFTSLESLQMQNAHLAAIAGQASQLQARALAAIQLIRDARAGAAPSDVRASLESTGAEIRDLMTALR